MTLQEGVDALEQFGFGDDLHDDFIIQCLLTLQALLSVITALPVDKRLCEIAYMQEPGENALYTRLIAIKPADLTLNAWTVRAGVNRMIFNDVKKNGNLRHDSLVKLLAAIGVSLADFEAGEVKVRTDVRGTGMTPEQLRGAWTMPDAKPLPLLGTAFGGEWAEDGDVEMTELRLAEVLDYLGRPPSLATDDEAYAVEIVGDSMEPRFEPGERVFVSPKAPVRVGDDVIVQLRAAGDPEGSDIAGQVTEVLIKRLVRRTAGYVELRQFNPDKVFRLEVSRIRRIHRVRGRL